MFSMKYTSPRVTPKKGAAPTPTPSSSTSSPLDRSAGASASSAAHKRSKSEGHALPSAVDSIRGNYGGNNNDDGGVHDILLDLKASESITNFNESATGNEPLLEPSAGGIGDQPQLQEQLTQDKIIANNNDSDDNNNHRLNNYAASILSENDSAVANVNVSSQQLLMGPSKSNLLALLDKEYNNDSVVKSSNSGEKNSNIEEMKQYHKIGIDAEGIADANSVGTDQQQQQDEVVGDILYKENENSNEPQSEECNEQQIDDEIDFDQTNDDTTATVEKEVEDDVDLDDIDDHHNDPDASTYYTPNSHKRSCLHHHSTKSSQEEEERQSSSSSSIKLLPKGLSLHETTSGSYEYRRTESMEPLLFDAHREDHSARTTATSPSFIKEENYLGPFENNDGGVLANQTQQREATNNHNDAERDTIQCTDPTSPIIYDMSNQQPASPLMSVIDSGNDESLPAGEKILFNQTTMARASPAITEATTSEIGGDTYFDKPAIHLNDDDLVHHVTLPPRVNRTTTMNTKESSLSTTPPFLTNCPISEQQAIIPGPIPMKRQKNPLPFSPRQPLFSHTRSLLDDCSEDEEEENNNNNNNNNNSTSYTIVDSPTRHMNPSYGCIPRQQRSNSDVSSSSPFSLYFIKKGGQQKKKRTSSSTSSSRNVPNQSNQQVPGGNANKVASNNIQQALLQTRHRRWDCQSAYAGSHAQSNQIFDISNRVVHYHLAGYNNHNISSSMKNNDGPMAAAARLSVSVEAVRAAALASGLWRTVRLVKLPKGLFNNSSSMDHHTPQQQQYRDDNTDEVWSLLKMLHFTFPSLEQIDFAGDIISRAIMNGNNDNDKMANNDGDDDPDDWRDELLTCIMECLPNIIAIDGFVIEQEAVVSGGGDVCDDEKVQMSPDPAVGRHKKDITQNKNNNNSPGEDNEESKAVRVGETSVVCVDCEEVPMCGLDFGADGVHILNDDASASNNEGEQATDRHSSENVVTTSTKAHNDSETAVAIDGSPSHDESMEDMRKVPLLSSSSSMLSSSSRSWESNGSGRTRPPRPNSATCQRPRIPSKPKKSKGSKFVGASGRLKRQVLGLIPTVSMMDEEEDEEEDSDDSEEIVEKDECPSDIL